MLLNYKRPGTEFSIYGHIYRPTSQVHYKMAPKSKPLGALTQLEINGKPLGGCLCQNMYTRTDRRTGRKRNASGGPRDDATIFLPTFTNFCLTFYHGYRNVFTFLIF